MSIKKARISHTSHSRSHQPASQQTNGRGRYKKKIPSSDNNPVPGRSLLTMAEVGERFHDLQLTVEATSRTPADEVAGQMTALSTEQ